MRVYIYTYIGAERFSKSCIARKQGEAKFGNIIVGRRDVLSRTKGVDEGWKGGGSVHFIGRYFHGVGTRARGQRHECLMERVGSVGSSGVASLSDISRDNVARRSNKRFAPMEAPMEREKDGVIDGEKVDQERMGDRARDSHRCRCFQPLKIPLFPYCFFYFFFFFFLLLAAFESNKGEKRKEKRERGKNDRCSLNANISFRRIIGPGCVRVPFGEITKNRNFYGRV